MNRISRKEFLQTAGVSAMGITALGMAGDIFAAEAEADKKMQAGVYTATAYGYLSNVVVEVSVDETAILEVKVTEHGESAGFGSEAIAIQPAAIVEKQSAYVDLVAGATATSAALRTAVSDCLKQAGAPDKFFQPVEAGELKEEELTVDVVVVGSGVAGFAAAVEAVEQGADVILLEKLGSVGGTTKASNGALMGAGSSLNLDTWNDPAALAEYWQKYAEGRADWDQLYWVAAQSGPNASWIMEDVGLEMTINLSPGDYNAVGAQWTHRPVDKSGWTFIQAFNKKYQELNGKLLLNTAAECLLTDETGAVVGLIAQSKDTRYTIHARGGVIMATGGFDNNQEMMKQFAPESAECCKTGANAGDTGEGILMSMDIGAATAWTGYGLDAISISDVDLNTDYADRNNSNVIDMENCFEITEEGKRFVNEDATDRRTFVDTEKLHMLQSGSKRFYLILDSNISDAAKTIIENAVDLGVAFKADTMEELAAKIDIPVDSLMETYNNWNAMAVAGEDTEFGNATIAVMDQAPFYAVRNRLALLGTFGGLKINLQANVLSTEGLPIKGLYAAGECASGEFYYRSYISGGTSLAMGTAFGREAARNAAARAKQN